MTSQMDINFNRERGIIKITAKQGKQPLHMADEKVSGYPWNAMHNGITCEFDNTLIIIDSSVYIDDEWDMRCFLWYVSM